MPGHSVNPHSHRQHLLAEQLLAAAVKTEDRLLAVKKKIAYWLEQLNMITLGNNKNDCVSGNKGSFWNPGLTKEKGKLKAQLGMPKAFIHTNSQ